jgi:dolichol-phosphate mannosyltransferase
VLARAILAGIFSSDSHALNKYLWQIIFVDDNSPDGTADYINDISKNDPQIHCIKRTEKRDLSAACVEGILASSYPYIVIMDADMQHDESIIPDMLKNMIQNKYDLVIGTRYKTGGSTGDLKFHRILISKFATWLGRLIIHKDVNDPMSGFFLIKKEFFNKVHPFLKIKGYKILLDIISSSDKNIRILEIPYVMRSRKRGKSKLNSLVVWQYIMLIIDKVFTKFLSIKPD